MDSTQALDKLQTCLGYKFKDQALLLQALSHRSFGANNNERLEFLGDSVLGFVISSALYQEHPAATEGELSRLRASLVNGETLAGIAKKLGVSVCLNLGSGELKSGGRGRASILADSVEAIIGAIFLDSDIATCRRCVLQWWNDCVNDLSDVVVEKDPKSRLQEWLQARQLPLPEYIAHVSGEAHAQQFCVVCRVKGLDHEAMGESTSRRKAERAAAEKYLALLDEEKGV